MKDLSNLENDTQRRKKPFLRGFFTIVGALGSTLTVTAQDREEAEEEIFELSPFTVDASNDTGYRATTTISGTRLNSSLKDIAASLTEVTAELMADLGAVNAEDVLSYVANTDVNTGQTSGDINANDGLFGATYTSRGFTVTNLSADFLPSAIPIDSYNTERITFARGPNSILFGLGNPGGITNASTKSALFRDLNKVALRFDNEGSMRAAIDVNRVLVEDKLALRLALLSDDRDTYTKPSALNKTERLYLAAKYKFNENANLRVHYETGSQDRHLDRQWIPGDALSVFYADPNTPKLVAGQEGTVLNNNVIPGLENFTNAFVPVVIDGLPGKSEVEPMVWRRMSKTPKPVLSDRLGRSYIRDAALFPWDANLTGAGNAFYSKFDNLSAFYEHRLFGAVDLQLTYNKQTSDRDIDVSSRTPTYIVYLDRNEVLPNGEPNPYFDDFYTESDLGMRIDRTDEKEIIRATLAYELDLQEKTSNELLGKFLGKHQFAVLGERYIDETTENVFRLHNVAGLDTDLPGPRASDGVLTNTLNGNNRIRLRWYLDPEAGVYGPETTAFNQYPLTFTGELDNVPMVGGFAPAWVNTAASPTREELESTLISMQSRFWDERLVVTLGWRQDEQTVYNPLIAAGTDRLLPDAETLDPRSLMETPRVVDGNTTTRGVVFHATDNISVFYNNSSSFLPPAPNDHDPFSRPFGNIKGEGEDYGVRFRLFDEKIFLSATWFDTAQNNAIDTGIVNATGIVLTDPINWIWDALEAYTGDAQYLEAPFKPIPGRWQATQDFVATGIEYEITANLTKQWRLTANLSNQENVVSDYGNEFFEYMDTYVPFWRSFDGFGAAPTLIDAYPTVDDAIARLQAGESRVSSLNGQSNGRQPEWSANLITNYTFSEDSRLDGFSVGGSLRWREARRIGYARDAESDGFIVSQPFFGEDTLAINGFARYRGKIKSGALQGTSYSIQLNIDNLFDDQGIDPILAEDDGTGTPVVVGALTQKPRTFALSTTFDF